MTVTVPEDIAQMVEHLSEASGDVPEQLVLSALRTRFAPIPTALLAEFEAWERASDYDCSRRSVFQGEV